MAAEIIDLNEEKRLQLFIKKLRPGKMYHFSKVVRSEFLVKGENQVRGIKFAFNKGVYLKFVKERDCLIFSGEPLVDLGDLGKGTFFVPLDLRMRLTLIERIGKKQ